MRSDRVENSKSFIEVQFPVSKISKESYKERMANTGQTLTGLGKWWGRKPLIMIRAAILGLLMPATDNPEKDREIFLKLLTLDEEGLWLRKHKPIPTKRVFNLVSGNDRKKYFDESNEIIYKKGIKTKEKNQLQYFAFKAMNYDEKIRYCKRPEQVDTRNLDWEKINNHFCTQAQNLSELIQELGKKRFGYNPTLGDCFCGGGSIPFEAARMGLNVFASELNPVGALLTKASLFFLNCSNQELENLKMRQEEIFDLTNKQICDWEIEHNEEGWRAINYLYCVETQCPECGYLVPLSPSWVIGKGTNTIARLIKNEQEKSYDIDIEMGVTKKAIQQAEAAGTVKNDNLVCPNCKISTSINVIRQVNKERGSNISGLRLWEKGEFVPREGDVFQERLYCIKYIAEKNNMRAGDSKYYVSPSIEDLRREEIVIKLLKERFSEWQKKGYIPSKEIQKGYNTSQLIRERGWTYWHHLFTPRQLLTMGLLSKNIKECAKDSPSLITCMLGLNKVVDFNSKLSVWLNLGANENTVNTFYNQSLNTLYNFATKTLINLKNSWFYNIKKYNSLISKQDYEVYLMDARDISRCCEIWLTDPPYADAVNYHELSEFFLAWDEGFLKSTFPGWYIDSKRALAVKGRGYTFNNSMIEIYKNLASNMPQNGMQLVLFTHQDVKVWAELAMIMWASGLKVTAAWNISTETESGGLKEGNYVKGTVLLVLRKQTSEETKFEDELFPEVEDEVKKQIKSMQDLDDKENPNFNDSDYVLASYASSLKVLTSYKNIEGIGVEKELSKEREKDEKSPVEALIRSAVKIAYDHLIPGEFDEFSWKNLTPKERFFIKGLELEREGVNKLGAYQELARGFGARGYQEMLASKKANNARLFTPSEFKMKGMQNEESKASIVRNALAAIYRAREEEGPLLGRDWLHNELEGYWGKRNLLMNVLDYLASFEHHGHMEHWHEDAKLARQIRDLVRQDGI